MFVLQATKHILGLILSLTFACLLLIPAPATAAILDVDPSGQLLGATNVNVDGTLYDVMFLDGSCITLFSECDATSDFPFQTEATAVLAAEALLLNVLTDTSAGSFDADPELINGCTNRFTCTTFIPYGLNNAPNINSAFLTNNLDAMADRVSRGSADGTDDTTNSAARNYAVFTLTPVPAPSSMALSVTGLLGLAGYRWQQRRRAGVQTV